MFMTFHNHVCKGRHGPHGASSWTSNKLKKLNNFVRLNWVQTFF